jgi:hypothetical protein
LLLKFLVFRNSLRDLCVLCDERVFVFPISAITRDFGDYVRYPGFPGKPDVGFLGWYKMSASPKEPHADNRLSPAKRDLLNLHHQ